MCESAVTSLLLFRIKSVSHVEPVEGKVPTSCYSIQGQKWCIIIGYDDGALRQVPGEFLGYVHNHVMNLVMTNGSLIVSDLTGRISMFRNGILYDRFQILGNVTQLCVEELNFSNFNVAAANSNVLKLFGGTRACLQVKLPQNIKSIVSFSYHVKQELPAVKCLAVILVCSNDIFIVSDGLKLIVVHFLTIESFIEKF